MPSIRTVNQSMIIGKPLYRERSIERQPDSIAALYQLEADFPRIQRLSVRSIRIPSDCLPVPAYRKALGNRKKLGNVCAVRFRFHLEARNFLPLFFAHFIAKFIVFSLVRLLIEFWIPKVFDKIFRGTLI